MAPPLPLPVLPISDATHGRGREESATFFDARVPTTVANEIGVYRELCAAPKQSAFLAQLAARETLIGAMAIAEAVGDPVNGSKAINNKPHIRSALPST